MRRTATMLSTAAVCTAMVTACSSGSATGPGTAAGSVPAPTTAGAKAAAAYLSKYTANPTSIGTLTQLSSKPSPGKKVIDLEPPAAVSQRAIQANSAAAHALGWSYSTISTGATPASAVAAFEAAITRHPDAISWTGYPAALFTKQINEARAAGITLISGVTGDGSVPGVLTDIGGKAQEELFGKLVAAFFVVHSDGKGQAGIFNIQALPVLGYFVDGFRTAVKQWCPDCSTTVVNQQLTDEGTKTPANVVALLQRNPGIKWAVFSAGDLAQGVRPAIQTAGLQGINIIGEVPTPTDIANLKAGTETAWAGYLTDVAAWRVYDILARHFTNGDVAAAAAVPLPLQMITAANANNVVVDSTGYYLGVADYQDQFKKLWHVN